ncbi:hypothetical protein BD410DRAFT_847252 [Rickenella mellea]|uniref:SET domain-containing protein n=1 Tax=Rickenella mellea TaxID=50990 RepID=A0A4Y7PD47_9AGAM|nr:hypothetical protein BD410DRAFT_847252 [Rickenella mellea]
MLLWDDAVVHGMYGVKKRDERTRRCKYFHIPARMAKSSSKNISLLAGLRDVFREHQDAMWRIKTPWAQYLQTPCQIVAVLSQQVKENFPKYVVWAISAYSLLYHEAGKVVLQKTYRHGSAQFCIVASCDLIAGEIIPTMFGSLSTDQASKQSTGLSEAFASDGMLGPKNVSRLLTGPIRFINHSCSPNVEFMTIDNTHSFVTVTNTAISKGQELFLDYGEGYWEEGENCECSVCTKTDDVIKPPPAHPLEEPSKTLKQKQKARASHKRRKERAKARDKDDPLNKEGRRRKADKRKEKMLSAKLLETLP